MRGVGIQAISSPGGGRAALCRRGPRESPVPGTVKQLATSIVDVDESAKATPKLSLSKILDGAELELDDGNLFGLEDLSEVVTAEDRAEAARRKEQLQTQFREAAQAMFGTLRTKASDLTKEHKELQTLLASKKHKPNGDPDA